jgi:methyl coenzyme M reductase subunit C-like uncharacterized protein (methanogenesis marker protein 7)
MLRLWNRKNNAVRNWRSKAWSIDPKVTNLTMIKTEVEKKIERLDAVYYNLTFNLDFPKLLKDYPQYFEALADMEQFG